MNSPKDSQTLIQTPKPLKLQPRVSLITCTGGRPEAFGLVEKYIASQTFKNFEWIVVDDYDVPTKCTQNQIYVRGPEAWEPGKNTQRSNMNAALDVVQGDFIFIIEDDDFYAPNYITTMMSNFSHSSLVGISNSRYYKVDMPGYATLGNYLHASLSQTAFSRNLLSAMRAAVNSGHFYFDIELWKAARNSQVPLTLIANSILSIGVKGMPGKPGLTPGHRQNKGYLMDKGLQIFDKWFGPYRSHYDPYVKKPVARK